MFLAFSFLPITLMTVLVLIRYTSCTSASLSFCFMYLSFGHDENSADAPLNVQNTKNWLGESWTLRWSIWHWLASDWKKVERAVGLQWQHIICMGLITSIKMVSSSSMYNWTNRDSQASSIKVFKFLKDPKHRTEWVRSKMKSLMMRF